MNWAILAPGIVLAVIAIGGLLHWARRRESTRETLRAATTASEAWKSNYEAERARSERLDSRLAESKLRIEALEDRVATLERELHRRPDLTVLLDLVDTRTAAILAAVGKETP